jgi:hypothetical protein
VDPLKPNPHTNPSPRAPREPTKTIKTMASAQVSKQPAKNAAEFFANKKRRGFKKFNANLFDAASSRDNAYLYVLPQHACDHQSPRNSTLHRHFLAHNQCLLSVALPQYSCTTHNRDAPTLSSSAAPPAAEAAVVESSSQQASGASWTNASSTAPTKPSLAYTLELTEDPNVVEKVQIEETKAQLAKAREGMERQAAAAAAAPPAAQKPAIGLGASRWVGARGGLRGPGNAQGLDVGNAQLFPDLAAAEKMAAAPAVPRAKPKLAARPHKKQPAKPPMVKPTLDDGNNNDDAKDAAGAAAVDGTVASSSPDPVVPALPTAAAIVAGTAASADAAKVVKKKKKDLSTFGKK